MKATIVVTSSFREPRGYQKELDYGDLEEFMQEEAKYVEGLWLKAKTLEEGGFRINYEIVVER